MNPEPLFAQYWRLINTPDLPDLGPSPRPSRLPLAELEARLDSFLGQASIRSDLPALLRSGALLWHDYLHESHQVSQGIASHEGSFLHGIMHRREPDFDNARHWFYRVGRHASFVETARKATAWLVAHEHKKLAGRLMPNGLWDPFAFIDSIAEAVAATPEAPPRPVLQQIQLFEFQSLFEQVLS